jgi:hypothetical protein
MRQRHRVGLTAPIVRTWQASAAIVALVLMTEAAAAAPPEPAVFVYCSSPSTSPRGRGLIVTAIFRSRSDTEFIANAFAGYLGSSYAPYGNGWIFPQDGPTCSSFATRRGAENRRSLEISRVPQPTQTVFNVTFELS